MEYQPHYICKKYKNLYNGIIHLLILYFQSNLCLLGTLSCLGGYCYGVTVSGLDFYLGSVWVESVTCLKHVSLWVTKLHYNLTVPGLGS